jgi:hypothetical protein
MKKTILICLTLLLVLMVSSSAMAGGKGKKACLVEAPANFSCSIDFNAQTVSCSWDALTGATKYAFEIVFEVPLLGDPNATQEVTFDAGTPDTSIVVMFGELQAALDPYGATLLGQTATAKVKGLNPPQKRARSQANTFQTFALDFTPPLTP